MSKYKHSTSSLILSLPLFLLSLSSCTSLSSPKDERQKTEISLHKIRTEVEDLKHDLNTSDIELHILEGKLIDQEETIALLKEQLLTSQNGKLTDLEQTALNLQKKLASFEKKQEEILADIRQLGSHANDTTTALSQYKDKICEMEKSILSQNKKFDEIGKIKKTLETLSLDLSKQEMIQYTIKEGDSLQKIAKQFTVSVEELKRINHLKDDLIFSGQAILIPKSN
jgi:chromosome segregation ATPase